jgi:predicted RNA methylase
MFQDKIVLEVDCGLGVFSTSVSPYAKKVIAVEASYLADLLSKIVADNKIENMIVVKDDIDNIEASPGDIGRVDILISQYMGYLLYDKQLLARLLRARDKFLKEGGIMMPDCIQLFIAGVDSGDAARSKKAADLRLDAVLLDEPKKEIVSERKVST